MKLIYFTVLSFLIYFGELSAQTISGNFFKITNQKIKLEGFDGFKTNNISEFTTDEKGVFKLKFTQSNYGVGYLICSDNKPLFVILSGEDIEIKGESLSYPETIKINKGKENQFFDQFSKEYPRKEQAMIAWGFLKKIYSSDSLFSNQKLPLKAIQDEKLRIKNEDVAFLETLPKDSYVKWFLPNRKLVSSVSTIAQYRPEEIPETIEALRKLDYTDLRLYKSGLFKDAIENHFWVIENSGKSLDNVLEETGI